MNKKLKVAFFSSEVVPFAKTGGLADVAGSLPQALVRQNAEVILLMPKYQSINAQGNQASLGKDVKVYFIENDKYFGRANLYGDKKGDYPDNLDRFSFYCRQGLEKLKSMNFKPDIIHCNDWQTALIPVYLKTIYSDDPFFKDTKTILTVHNLAYQGIFPAEQFSRTGLPESMFNLEGLEFFGKINLLKGGLLYATVLNTVSQAYAQEIQTKEYGCGLEGILKNRAADLYGVVNGIDYQHWDPETDKRIFKNYSVKDFKDKYVNKHKLQKEVKIDDKFDGPFIGIISRLADQKGLDLISAVIDKILDMDIQFILLGTGDEPYHVLFEQVAKKYPGKTSINLRFDAVLAQRIYAGCDMFLMPSRYEPCGLGQIISFKYGTIPIVRETGGLADTVIDYDSDEKKGNGFMFEEYSPQAFLETVKRAIGVYQDKASWEKLIKRVMKLDFSWDQSAKKYVDIYKLAMKKKQELPC